MPCSPVDLWRALGGDEDLLGTINRDEIARILSQEFDLVNGVVDWLREAEGENGMINYQSFKALFENSSEENISILSGVLSRTEVNERDLAKFENWIVLNGM